MPKSVLIVGAGVIGLILAGELGKAGIDTTVYESKASVSQNAARASGIFSREGLSKIGIGYKKAMLNTLNGAVVHGGGQALAVQTPDTKAYVLDRGILAGICADEATANGAEIVLNKRLTKDELVELSKDDNRIIVGADGAVSSVASAFGFPQIKEYVLTYKAEYENAEINDMHKVELFFSNNVSNRFFGWTVPYSPTKLEVGVGVSSYSKKTSSSAFGAFIKTREVEAMIGSAKKVAGYASIIPIRSRKKTVIGNVLLVGDAAGQVKATTGGGIIFGAACAKLASKAILDNIDSGKPLERYERLWRKNYGLDLKLHRALHHYYSGLGDRSLAAAIMMSKLFGFERFLSRYGDMDSPSLMLKRFFLRKISN
jgi:Dehydrogenases (flavoproteins)